MENEIVITAVGVLWVLGSIITIGGASAVISRWLAPFRKLKDEVADKVSREEYNALKEEYNALKKEVEELQKYQKTDHDELKKIETGIEKTCKCVLAITDHELTGNSVDKLREAKDEMQDYLIQK